MAHVGSWVEHGPVEAFQRDQCKTSPIVMSLSHSTLVPHYSLFHLSHHGIAYENGKMEGPKDVRSFRPEMEPVTVSIPQNTYKNCSSNCDLSQNMIQTQGQPEIIILGFPHPAAFSHKGTQQIGSRPLELQCLHRLKLTNVLSEKFATPFFKVKTDPSFYKKISLQYFVYIEYIYIYIYIIYITRWQVI